MDAGDLLFAQVLVTGQPHAQLLRDRARLLARAALADGVAAVNVGRRDLAAGLAFLQELEANPGVPWVATNLRSADGEHPFPRWRLVRWGGASVAVVGFLAPNPAWDGQLGVRVDPPAEALREVLPHLSEAAAVLCLSNLGRTAEQALAREFPELAFVVGGGPAEYLPVPPVEGHAVLLHASNRGQYLGVLDVPAEALHSWRAPRNLAEEDVLGARLDILRGELREGPQGERPLTGTVLPLEERIARAEEALAALRGAPAVFRHRVAPLEARGGEVPEVLAWVQEYKSQEQEWRRRQVASPPPAPIAPAAAPGDRTAYPAQGVLHAGSASCRSCHAEAYRAWARTPHARAYAALKGDSRNPECLACHSTSLQRATGPSLEPVVGCEACHGPGGRHRGEGVMVRQPAEASCRACHRGFHGEEPFAFPQAYEAVRCDREGRQPEQGR
ncbi:MAG: multiheme c-type cytochrome [Deferrisomatales bacterium]